VEWLSGLDFGNLTAGAILAIWVLLIMLGKIPTPGQIKDLREDCAAWRTSSDNWQKSAHESGMAVHELSRAVDKLIAQGEATNHALTEIQQELTRGWDRP
jgi:hypothetical protein